MLPISLIVVTDYSKPDDFERMLKSARPIVSEVIIVYQGNDSAVHKKLISESDLCLKSSFKGNADPDRNHAYSLATQPWILALDDDEWLPDATKSYIGQALLSPADVVWFNFRNNIDGVNMHSVLGDDPHPRLWRNNPNLIAWPDRAHTYPKINSELQIFTKHEIVHERRFADVEARHKSRARALDPEMRQKEQQFLEAVKRVINKS